jgi:mannose-6-phosphate isomerase-like protein (cupin superfamily)
MLITQPEERCMALTVDLSTTFIHLRDGGGAEPVEATPSFWGGSAGKLYDRLVGAFDFNSSEDLHSSIQEMHPEADEVLFLVSGAVDVVLQKADAERTIALEAGQAAIVPRGVWHRLVMRHPGRLLFINSRTGMQSRNP